MATSKRMALRQVLLDKYGTQPTPAASEKKAIANALVVMKMVENDGSPIPITNHDYLFVGSIGAAYNLTALVEKGITHIICATPSSRLRFPDQIEYMRLHIHDRPHESIGSHFETTSAFIENARMKGGKVLIHCFQGKSRSATIIAAYLVKHHGMTAESAIDLIRTSRPHACPNPGFVSAICQLERELQSPAAVEKS